MKNTKTLLIAVSIFLLGCEQQDCCAPLDVKAEVMGNEWLLYETGSSSGSGYTKVAVPVAPAQKLKFHEDGRLIHTIEGWSDYQFYLFLDDPQSERDILSFHKTDPGNDPQDIHLVPGTYTFSIEEGRLKLRYRGCTEPCHLSFKRIPN
jgi:hypothetical protein